MGGRLKGGEFSCMRQHVSQHAIGLEEIVRRKRKYAEDTTIILFDFDEEGCTRTAPEGNGHVTEDEATLTFSLVAR